MQTMIERCCINDHLAGRGCAVTARFDRSLALPQAYTLATDLRTVFSRRGNLGLAPDDHRRRG
jgi:hypothetical protein